MYAALRLLVAVSLMACGYAPLRPDAGGPTATLAIGTFVDPSPEGDLGLRVGQVVRARLAGRERPRVARSGPTLSGVVTVGEDHGLSGDTQRLAASYALDVTVTAALRDGGRALWVSGPVRRRAVFLRGETPLESQRSRRVAVADAVDQAAHNVVDRLLAASEVIP